MCYSTIVKIDFEFLNDCFKEDPEGFDDIAKKHAGVLAEILREINVIYKSGGFIDRKGLLGLVLAAAMERNSRFRSL